MSDDEVAEVELDVVVDKSIFDAGGVTGLGLGGINKLVLGTGPVEELAHASVDKLELGADGITELARKDVDEFDAGDIAELSIDGVRTGSLLFDLLRLD